MKRHLSIGTILETHKISSDVAFVEMLEIDALDTQGDVIETLYFCRNSENIVYKGNTYIAGNFSVDISSEAGEEAKVTLTAKDPSGILRSYMEDYEGGINFPVRLLVLNSDRLDYDPEFQQEFIVVGANSKGIDVVFNLGAENPLARAYPFAVQFKDRCRHKYKGTRCKYAGPLETCDYTRDGANGCKAHNNAQNFGGFYGLNSL